jgi:hypothetical protein
MPMQYPQEAIDLCGKLYCKYGGMNHDRIEREMRKQYPGWRKKNLYDSGSGKQALLGWINREGFDNLLKIHVQKLTESVNDDEQDLYIGIRTVRKAMQSKVVGKSASKDDLETFVAGYEKMINWLTDIDPVATKLLIKHGEKLSEMAQAHYGKAETDDDGASDRADEGGE